MLSKSHRARAVGLLGDRHADAAGATLARRFGEQGLYEFGPLDETRMAAVEIIVDTDIVSLFETLDTVEVEVEDRSVEHRAVVLVDDGERGAVDHIVDTKLLAEGFDESRLARAHLTVEGVDGRTLAKLHQLDEVGSSLANAI